MFCKNCGKEINDDIKYCNFCGNDVRRLNPTPKNIYNFNKKAVDFFLPLGEAKKWLILIMFLLLLNPLLSMCENYKFSESITGQNVYSETFSVFKDVLLMLAEEIPFVGFLIFVGILAIIFAEIFMVVPLIKRSKYKSIYLIPTKIISIIAFLFIMFLNVGNFIESNNNEFINYTLTFWGWLLNLDIITLVVITFKLSSIIKKKNKKEKEIEKL